MSFANDSDFSFPIALGLVDVRLDGNPQPRQRDSFYWDSSSESSQCTPELPCHRKTDLEYFKRSAGYHRANLACFPAGKALLRTKDLDESNMNPDYWRLKRDYYESEYNRMIEEYQRRKKRNRSNTVECLSRPTRLSGYRKRAREPVVMESQTERTATRKGKTTGTTDVRTIQGNTRAPKMANSLNWDGKKGRRPTTRRKYKSEHRAGSGESLSNQTQQPHYFGCSMVSRPSNSYKLLSTNEANAIKGRSTDTARQGLQNYTSVQLQHVQSTEIPNPTLTCSENFEIRTRQLRQRKNIARQRRRRNTDSAYLGSRSTCKAADSISSRLRSSEPHRV